MTENLLQKLEEKMMMLLAEVEELRKDVSRLNHENSTLKFDREVHTRKLQDLLALLDAVNVVDNAMATATAAISVVKPVLVQQG